MIVPNVKRIVYSTCSIHTEENEQVVLNVLSTPASQSFKLAKREHVLPSWTRRGKVIEGFNEGLFS